MTDLKKLIQIVRAVQKDGYETLSSDSVHRTQWLLEAASAVLALRCMPEQYRHECGRLNLTIYSSPKKPSQNLLVVASLHDNEWVSMPLRIFNGAAGSALTIEATKSGGVHVLEEYHKEHKVWERDSEGIAELMCENDDRIWCKLWALMDTTDQFKVPQVLSFSEHGQYQLGALEERLSLMGKVSVYREMADKNLIP